MNNSIIHQKLVDDILYAVGSLPNVRLWPRHVGGVSNLGNTFNQRFIRYGIPGESDLQGILSPSGRYICFEIKTGKGKLSKAQKTWRDMMISFGAVYKECRSVEDALEAIKQAM